MRVLLFDRAEEAAEWAAAQIAALAERKPEGVLGLPVGRTAIPLFESLVRAGREGRADLARLRLVLLDEYLGLAEDDPRSHRRFLRERLLDPLALPAERVLLPPSEGGDLATSCLRFEERLAKAGGIDLQLLGIGANGHVGFNEPGSSLASRTRAVTLMRRTLRDAAAGRNAGEPPPEMAVTLGVGTLLEARRLILLAFGEGKATAVRNALQGPLGASCPASALQLHPDPTVALDAGAASALDRRLHHSRAQRNEEALRRGRRPPGSGR